jgi:hypothetical protein
MATISLGRACNEHVTCLRIFADANGETHMEDIDIDLQPRKLFKDNPPLRLTRITSQPRGIMFAMSQRVWGKRVGTIRLSVCLCSG